MVWGVLIGREAKGDYYDPKTWEVFLRAGERIDEATINRLEKLELAKVEAKLQGIEHKPENRSHRVISPRKIKSHEIRRLEDKPKRTHRVLRNGLHRVTSPREITFREVELSKSGRIKSQTFKTIRSGSIASPKPKRQTIRSAHHRSSRKRRINDTVVMHRGKRKSFPCRVKGCNKTFATVKAMEQHVKDKHNE